jgi:acetyl-CoA decarbonylase/synthase complex subunit delta
VKEPEFLLETDLVRGTTEELVGLIPKLKTPSVIAYADENNYKALVPLVIEGGHRLVIRTPIDINLAKEMNILASDLGLPLDKIIIDTDIGGLGYGLEYGYSMIEKIKLADDEYLNRPIMSFVVEETLKTKEAKASARYALFAEITAASAAAAAGADYVVMRTPEACATMKEVKW